MEMDGMLNRTSNWCRELLLLLQAAPIVPYCQYIITEIWGPMMFISQLGYLDPRPRKKEHGPKLVVGENECGPTTGPNTFN